MTQLRTLPMRRTVLFLLFATMVPAATAEIIDPCSTEPLLADACAPTVIETCTPAVADESIALVGPWLEVQGPPAGCGEASLEKDCHASTSEDDGDPWVGFSGERCLESKASYTAGSLAMAVG